MPRRLLIGLVALGGCGLLTGPDSDFAVRIEVDPTVVRTIHYYPSGPGVPEPPSEVTTLSLDEIGCLQTTPRGCFVHETIHATIRNVGSRAVYRTTCGEPLERWGLGSWHPVTRGLCGGPIDFGGPPGIRPNEEEVVEVRVDRAPPGEYRVAFTLTDGEKPLSSSLTRSASFQLVPLPDSPLFVCPTESKEELAIQIAQEALDSAWVGGATPDLAEFLVIEHLVPGFGGLYFDNGVLTAWLQDLSLTDKLIEVVLAARGGTPRVNEGDYSFSQLVGWKEVVSQSGLFQILGVSSLDADERSNRVRIEIANELIRGDVECLVRGIGMPEGMASIDVW